MIFFITVIKALAACLITNAHYTGIYPNDIIANGGLLGDALFFAVSGFCLCNIKKKPVAWYMYRIKRIYPAVLVITLIYIALGFYTFEHMNILQWLIYPTRYHFIASIIILYIPFYFFAKYPKIRKIGSPILIVFWSLVYIVAYDKSYYHIDNVKEPLIRLFFFFAMLLGMHFRQCLDKYRNNGKWTNWLGTFLLFVLYFATKLAFTKFEILSSYQIVNQIILLLLVYYIFKSFSGIDWHLENMPAMVKKAVGYIAQITLEIYLVQYALIDELHAISVFPINWLIVTGAILLVASALHFTTKYIIKIIDRMITKTHNSCSCYCSNMKVRGNANENINDEAEL